MQTDFDKDLLTYFTDVEHLRDAFEDAVATQTLPKRLLVIHGVGGVGKSSLLRVFAWHCKGVHVPVALASGDEARSALAILSNWADDLKADGVTLATFAETLRHYQTVQSQGRKLRPTGLCRKIWIANTSPGCDRPLLIVSMKANYVPCVLTWG